MIHRLARNKDERGAVLVLSTVGLVMALIMGGFAVELGFIAQEARRNQKVADMAALDSVRMLPNDPTAAAITSAARNSFTDTSRILTQWGPSKTGPWSSDPAALATAKDVRVTITSVHKNQLPFLSDGQNVVRRGVAEKRDIAGFTLGSSLANFNSSKVTLINPIMSKWLGGSVNLSLVGWQGLASGKVTLEAIRQELVNNGFSVGTVDQMLTTTLTLAQFYKATAQALAKNGDTANANVFDALRLQAVSSTTFKLGKMITIGQGGSDAAASAQLNLLQLVTGSAMAVNGANAVSISDVSIAVPNVSKTALSLKVIEGPKIYIGPAGSGPHVTTGQIQMTLTPTIGSNVLGVLKVGGTTPIDLLAAGATGTLKSIQCPQKNIVVTADPVAVSSSTKTTTLNVTTLLGLQVLDAYVTTARNAIDGPAQDIPFTYDTDFNPPNTVSKHVGSQPIGLNSLTNVSSTSGNVNVANLLTLGLSQSSVLTAVNSLVSTVIGDVDQNIVTPLLSVLGLDVGGADVTALGRDPVTGLGLPQCGLPTLAA
ncbi:MAG: pilus assembly protein TadG-related protein [Actinomycetota bacterium]|nr:pilus assembly protein TadG-related protein [Actinomycetota bacterium]